MVTCWAVNPEVPGSIPGLGPEISEILFVVFPAISDHADRKLSIWLKVTGSCVSVLYTGHIKEPGCLFKVRARRIVCRTCMYLIFLSPFWVGFLSVCLSHCALVEDAPAPLWLQHYVKRL